MKPRKHYLLQRSHEIARRLRLVLMTQVSADNDRGKKDRVRRHLERLNTNYSRFGRVLSSECAGGLVG